MSHLHHKVSALIDGELQGAARKRALTHLRHCSDCQHEVEATLALKHRLVDMPHAEPSADLFASLETTPSPDDDASRSGGGRAGRSARRVLVGMGSVSVAVLSLAYVIGAPETAVEASVSPPVDEASANLAGGGASSALADPAVDALLLTVGGGAAAMATVKRSGSGSASAGVTDVPGLVRIAAPVGPPHGDDPAAVAELVEAAIRPDRISYALTRNVESIGVDGTTSVAIRVVHVPDQGTRFRVIGRQPTAAVFVADRPGQAQARADERRVQLLTESYDVGLRGHELVDGRSATVVSIGRAGALVAEFWIDDETGVLLRRELFDEGSLVRTSEVTSLQLRGDRFMPHLPTAFAPPATAHIKMGTAAQLGDAGWTCPASLFPGLSLTALGRLDEGNNVMVAQYSDGLSTVSIFEQRGALDTAQLTGFEHHVVAGADVYVHYGLPTIAFWQSGDVVYTAATDMPEQEVARLIEGMPHESSGADDGTDVMTRVGTGLARMAGFVSPAS